MAQRVTVRTLTASAAVSISAVAVATAVSPPGSVGPYIARSIGIVLVAVALVHGTHYRLTDGSE